MPQFFMGENGVKPEDLAGGGPGFSGSHDATIAVVQSGAYEVGALNEQVWQSNVADGRVDTDKVSVIWRTACLASFWVASQLETLAVRASPAIKPVATTALRSRTDIQKRG